MAKPLFIAIHGMGEHTKKSFRAEISAPLNKAMSHFQGLKDKYHFALRLEDDDDGLAEEDKGLDLVVIEYNSIFNELRKELADNAGEIESKLGGLASMPSLVTRLINLDSKLNQNKFFYTHLLDVIFYHTFYEQKIQVHVAKQILGAIDGNNYRPIHFIGHSLGTAVLHDTLHKLYRNEFTQEQKDEMGNYIQLDAEEFRINTINMVANVSKLLPAGKDPYTSIVKAGEEGICNDFINCRHVLDPFTVIQRFTPKTHWSDLAMNNYHNEVINDVERGNVHDIDHYLADPVIFEKLFIKYFPGYYIPTPTETESAREEHRQTTLQGDFDRLRDEIKNAEVEFSWNEESNELEFPDKDDFDDIIKSFAKLKDKIDSLAI